MPMLSTALKKNLKENLVEKGAYTIKNFDNYDATILATGSEVEIAHKTSEELEKNQIIYFSKWLCKWKHLEK